MGLFSSEISTKKMVPLCRQLATTYEAGIPVVQGFDVVGSQLKDRRIRDVLTTVRDDIKQGATLGEAVHNQRKYLPIFFVQLLAVGEEGGRLDAMLRDLADYYEDRLALQRRVIGSMIYPGIQLGFAWFLGSFALMTIGRLQEAIQTRMMEFNFNALIGDYVNLQIIAGFVLVFVLLAAIVLSRLGVLGYVTGLVSTFVPPFAGATRKFALARFFRSMALLVTSGLGIVKCVEGAATVAANPYIRNDLLKVRQPIKDGESLTEAFARTRYLPPIAHEMLAVGEQSGQLEVQLRKLSHWFTEEAQGRVNMIVRFMNALIILGVGLLIGYIVITFWTSYYGGMLDAIGA